MVKVEKLGKPAVFIVAKHFELDARFNAKSEGLSDFSVVVLPVTQVPPPEEIEKMNLGDIVADKIIEGLTEAARHSAEAKETVTEVITFAGNDYAEALGNMEKHFLQHGWSDGLPLVPPTEAAVSQMLEGIGLPRHHLVASIEPAGGKATVEKIAVNAVMAGCLPHYMPVIISAVEAIAEPMFDLRGVQCTAGMVSPLLVISGQKLIQQLNINDSFSTIGPGWRANATIGRAIRLVMINIGQAWPGKPDMKSFGNPFKYVMLMAENEAAYKGAWEPIRVAEGFGYDQPTISVMPAYSWQPDMIQPEPPDVARTIATIAWQAKAKYDRLAWNWGTDNLVLISPDTFNAIIREKYSRADIQKALYDAIKLPGSDFFVGQEPSTEAGPNSNPIPEWIVEKCKADPEALVPLLRAPENIKLCVAGGTGPGMVAYIGTWGYGPSYFITKAIKLPSNWENLLEKYKGWESPNPQ